MRGKQDNERAGCDRASLYAEITCKIIAGLERGCLPWVQPWASRSASAPLALPDNAATRRRYTGINVLVLWSEGIRRGFPANRWLTFRQALALGGHIRRGERGVAIVYADRFIPKGKNRRRDGPDEEGAAIPFLKRFTVFNVAQCDSLPEDVAVSALSGSSLPIEPQVEALIRASRIDFRVGGDRAFYAPAHDFVQVPPHDAFYEPINWYRTALHELGHATGHPSRLNRDLSGVFGSKKYAFEELVAEISAAFCCSALGIAPTVRHADYIASWLGLLREDDRAIFRAASRAGEAADWLLGRLGPAGQPGAKSLVDRHP